jgi:hypothetical protein
VAGAVAATVLTGAGVGVAVFSAFPQPIVKKTSKKITSNLTAGTCFTFIVIVTSIIRASGLSLTSINK